MNRVRRIYKLIDDRVDLVLFTNSTDPHLDLSFFYATGITDGLFEGCTAFCHPDGSAEVLTSSLEEEAAKACGLPLHVFRTRAEREALMKKLLRGHRRIGINFPEITHKAVAELTRMSPRARLVDVSAAVTKARLVKDEGEVASIRRAAQIASRALEEVTGTIRAGRRESEVAADLVYAMQRRGASGPSFRTIVGSGPNGAEPHYTAGPRKLRRGDLVVIDFGARYEAYCSDVTRTVAVGRASAEQRAMYETVARAQGAALRRMRPGARAKSVDAAARDVIDASPYKGRFIHGLGHSVGLAVHDGGALNQTSDVVLARNMVFTNEPGVYISGFGGVRIEDDVLVTGGAPRFLSTATRELLEL